MLFCLLYACFDQFLGMNIEAKVASTQQGTEESALEENLLLPPKQTNRGVVERNPLAYDKSSNEVDSGSEAAASSERFVDNTGQVYVEPQMLQIQTESYNRDTTSEVSFLQGPSLTTSFVPDNNMRQDIRIGMQSDAYHSNFDSTLQTANTKVTDSLDSQTRATSDSELTGQTNVTSENVSHWRNGSESDSSEVIDSRLLEWKMSAYTSPSFQKPQ